MEGDLKDFKKCLYRCGNCGHEWHQWIPRYERKLRRWCRNKCGHIVSPYQTQHTESRERQSKTTKPKSLW
jgi:hypothetical protein